MASELVREPGAVRVWSRLIACVVGRAYYAFVLTLLAAALVPAAWGWTGYVVRSGSMEPSVSVGDTVVAMPFEAGDEVPLGRVVVFDNPARPGQRLVHRVVGELGGGEFATAGDANASNDPEPITADDVEARARILVPFVGRPAMWLANRDVVPLLVWSTLTVLALAAAVRGPRSKRPGGPGSGGPLRRPARRRAAALAGTTVALAIAAGTQPAGAAFTAQTVTRSNLWTVGSWPVLDYAGQVLADRPYVFYKVDEAAGTTNAADSSGNGRTGSYSSIAAYRQADALPNNPGYAVRFDGSTDRLVSSGQVTNPTTFSLELWFRTTTTEGGKLIGFESTRGTTSPAYDRHVFMRSNGRLVYGGWLGSDFSLQRITTPAAYNDGQWHHLVLTARGQSGQPQTSTMYVDGQPVVSGTTTRPGSYSGFWRVGYGGWADLDWVGTEFPSSANFSGTIDQVAVYHSELSAARVAAHWGAR